MALLLSDQIWLWSRGHEGGGPQAELLRRVAHWLMQEPELEENALTARVAEGRLTIERRSTDPAPPGQVTVTDPGRQDADADADADAPGPGHRQPAGGHARASGRRATAARTAYAAAGAANPPEFADLRATATLLRKLARGSGGGVHFRLGTAGAPPDVPELRRTEPDRPASGSSLDRAAAAARPCRDRHRLAGAAAGLARVAADAGAAGAGLAPRRHLIAGYRAPSSGCIIRISARRSRRMPPRVWPWSHIRWPSLDSAVTSCGGGAVGDPHQFAHPVEQLAGNIPACRW